MVHQYNAVKIYSIVKKIQVTIPCLADKKDLGYIHISLTDPHQSHTAGMTPQQIDSFNLIMKPLGFGLMSITGYASSEKLDEDGNRCNVLTLVYEEGL